MRVCDVRVKVSWTTQCFVVADVDTLLSTVYVCHSPDGIDGDQVGQLAIITRSNYTLFKEAVNLCVYSDSDAKVAFAGVRFLSSSLLVLRWIITGSSSS